MQRRTNTQISSLLVLVSILTIILQIASYYFFGYNFIVLVISSVISVICCHILVEQSDSFGICFDYSILTLFMGLIITVLACFSNEHAFITYSDILTGIIVINWLLPVLYCFIRYMTDIGSHAEDYPIFFRKSSILFIITYLFILIYGSFDNVAIPLAYKTTHNFINFTPFWSISAQIEEYLNGKMPLSDIILYLCSRILIFIPYGYYCVLLLRKKSKLVKFFVLLVLPFLIELFQGILNISRCDIDDLIYALIGGLLGSLCYHLMNSLFKLISGKDFLAKANKYHMSGSPLHF